MSNKPPSILRTTLFSIAALVATVFIYFLGLVIVGVILSNLPMRAASTVIPVWFLLIFLVAIVSCRFIFLRTQGVLQPLFRALWMIVFTLMQLGVAALAVMMSMVATNR